MDCKQNHLPKPCGTIWLIGLYNDLWFQGILGPGTYFEPEKPTRGFSPDGNAPAIAFPMIIRYTAGPIIQKARAATGKGIMVVAACTFRKVEIYSIPALKNAEGFSCRIYTIASDESRLAPQRLVPRIDSGTHKFKLK